MSLAAFNVTKPFLLVATCCLIPYAGALGFLYWQCDVLAETQPSLVNLLTEVRDTTIVGSLVLALVATFGCSVVIKPFLKDIQSQLRTIDECERLMSSLQIGRAHV